MQNQNQKTNTLSSQYVGRIDLNTSEEGQGAFVFQCLLQKYKLELKLDSSKENNGSFQWANADHSLVLSTLNNPLTGQYFGNTRSACKTGYLSHVTIETENKNAFDELMADLFP